MIGAVRGVLPVPGCLDCQGDGSCGRQICKGASLQSMHVTQLYSTRQLLSLRATTSKLVEPNAMFGNGW